MPPTPCVASNYSQINQAGPSCKVVPHTSGGLFFLLLVLNNSIIIL